MIIDCISDLHGEYPELEGGDLLIVAGDLTATSTMLSLNRFDQWIYKQNYKKMIFISGNHDNILFEVISPALRSLWRDPVTYLCDSGTEFEGLKIWGSPWTMTFPGISPNCKAFTTDSKDFLNEKWNLIPDDTDILITHCPPYGILDHTIRFRSPHHCGSGDLFNHVIKRIKPKLHVFGHIHEHGGWMQTFMNTTFVNASIMNKDYDSVNKPVRVIL